MPQHAPLPGETWTFLDPQGQVASVVVLHSTSTQTRFISRSNGTRVTMPTDRLALSGFQFLGVLRDIHLCALCSQPAPFLYRHPHLQDALTAACRDHAPVGVSLNEQDFCHLEPPEGWRPYPDADCPGCHVDLVPRLDLPPPEGGGWAVQCPFCRIRGVLFAIPTDEGGPDFPPLLDPAIAFLVRHHQTDQDALRLYLSPAIPRPPLARIHSLPLVREPLRLSPTSSTAHAGLLVDNSPVARRPVQRIGGSPSRSPSPLPTIRPLDRDPAGRFQMAVAPPGSDPQPGTPVYLNRDGLASYNPSDGIRIGTLVAQHEPGQDGTRVEVRMDDRPDDRRLFALSTMDPTPVVLPDTRWVARSNPRLVLTVVSVTHETVTFSTNGGRSTLGYEDFVSLHLPVDRSPPGPVTLRPGTPLPLPGEEWAYGEHVFRIVEVDLSKGELILATPNQNPRTLRLAAFLTDRAWARFLRPSAYDHLLDD